MGCPFKLKCNVDDINFMYIIANYRRIITIITVSSTCSRSVALLSWRFGAETKFLGDWLIISKNKSAPS